MKSKEPQEALPETLQLRIGTLAPVVEQWRASVGKRKSWSEFLRTAIGDSPAIRKIAGKRHEHLLDEQLP